MLVARKPVEIRGDAECRLLVAGPDPALSAVIRNLLRNALCDTDAGRVRISIVPRRLRIENSGIGMDPRRIKEIFRPYFRGEPQRRGGHGVGLTIVRRFADHFGGSVDIQSEPGIGTQVEVGFPDVRCLPEQTA